MNLCEYRLKSVASEGNVGIHQHDRHYGALCLESAFEGACMELLKEVEKLNVERASGGAPLQIESLVDEGLKIRVNRKSVVKVLNELVHNAQKYGLVPSHEKDNPIILRARLGYNKLIFSVEDKGPGVPADYRANIFNPFIKANSFSEGLGLGLFVAQRYAVMMGGNLTLDEGYTSGARFILSIPQ